MYTRAIVVTPVHNLQKVEGHLAPAKCPIAQLVKPLICHDDKWVLINVVFLQYLTQILCYSALTIAVYLTFFHILRQFLEIAFFRLFIDGIFSRSFYTLKACWIRNFASFRSWQHIFVVKKTNAQSAL